LCFQSGGDDAEPVFGRLGSVEPIAKPTNRSVFCFLYDGGGERGGLGFVEPTEKSIVIVGILILGGAAREITLN